MMAMMSSGAAPAQDLGWPRQITKPSGKLVYYQPQVDAWKSYQTSDARLAFTITPTGGKMQVGVLTVQMQTSVNMDTHTVVLSNPQITSVTFPSLGPVTSASITGAAAGAIVASGTGYYYPPYVYGGFYYPYPATYGYHTYNPYTGAYGHGGAAYGPYGSAHWGTSYNPNTGTYARGATESTPYGTRSAAEAYNPCTGASAATRQGSDAYGSWGQSVVSKNGNTAYTQHASNAYGSAGTVQTAAGGKGAATGTGYGNTAVGKTSNGDMYAGHDGNVYKNTGSGWQTYNNGSWNDVNKPTTASAQSYDQRHLASSNPNYASAQQKAQSNPNYSADQSESPKLPPAAPFG